MVGWHHWLNGHEFEQVLGVGGGQGSLACCSPWGCRVGHDLVPSLHGKQMGKQWKKCQNLFWGAPKSLQMVTVAMKLKDAYSLEGKL